MLPYFFSCPDPSEPGKLFSGTDALHNRFSKAEELYAENEALNSLGTPRCFHTFNWLLAKEQQDKHNEWVSRALVARGVSRGPLRAFRAL